MSSRVCLASLTSLKKKLSSRLAQSLSVESINITRKEERYWENIRTKLVEINGRKEQKGDFQTATRHIIHCYQRMSTFCSQSV